MFLNLFKTCFLSFRNKYLLLNSQELNELSAISMKANIPEVEALVNTDRSLVCDGKKGLLTRLLTVMKREPPDSSFRSASSRARSPRRFVSSSAFYGFADFVMCVCVQILAGEGSGKLSQRSHLLCRPNVPSEEGTVRGKIQ